MSTRAAFTKVAYGASLGACVLVGVFWVQSGGTSSRFDSDRVTQDVLAGLDRRDAAISSLSVHATVHRETNSDTTTLRRYGIAADRMRVRLSKSPSRWESWTEFQGASFLERCRHVYPDGTAWEEMTLSDGVTLHVFSASSGPGAAAPSHVKTTLAQAKDRDVVDGMPVIPTHVCRPSTWLWVVGNYATALSSRVESLRRRLQRRGAGVVGEDEIAGLKCYRLQAHRFPRIEGQEVSEKESWWVSPEKGFNLVMYRKDLHRPGHTAGPGFIMRSTWQVRKWRQFGKDLWLPAEIIRTESNVYPEGKEIWKERLVFKVKSLEVNKPIPPETFKPPDKFP